MKHRQEFKFLTLCAFVAFIFLTFPPTSEANSFFEFFRNLFARPCKTKECIEAADTIHVNMNRDVDPCEDFYEFACGGWIRNHPLLPNTTRRDRFREIQNATNERVAEILTQADNDTDPQSLKDVRKLYRSCIASDDRADENMEFLLDRLSQYGGWPIASENWNEQDFDWQAVMVDMIRKDGVSPLFDISIGLDRKNISRYTLMLDQPDIGLCSFIRRQSNEVVRQLFQYINGTAHIVAKAANQTISEEQIETDAEMMINFESIICWKLTTSFEREDHFRMYNPMTLKELQETTDEITSNNDFSNINWLRIFQDYVNSSDTEIDENERVVVIELDYLEEALHLLKRNDGTTKRVIANYLLWKKIISMDLSRELRDLGNTFLTAFDAEPRIPDCVDFVTSNLGHPVGYEYVRLYFDAEAKTKAHELADRIRDTFVEHLKNVDWMDSETRHAAVEKAENLLLAVGYPDWYNNFSTVNDITSDYVFQDSLMYNKELIKTVEHAQHVNRLSIFQEQRDPDFVMSPTSVNAFYLPEFNSIGLPAAIFQAPFYVKGRPEALNYGGVGAVIGHEMSHAFDMAGRSFDKVGNLYNWWTEKTARTFQSKQRCMEGQYEQFPVRDYQNEVSDEKLFLDGTGTVSENIADNGGLQEALGAYRQYVEEHGQEQRLPGLTKYSLEQLFYIGYATIYCETSSREGLEAVIRGDVHSPSKYRVVIPLSNTPDFAKAWKCKQNDLTMNPNHRCPFW